MEREHSGHLHSGDTPYHSHDDVDMAYLGMFHHDHGDHTHDDEPPPTPCGRSCRRPTRPPASRPPTWTRAP